MRTLAAALTTAQQSASAEPQVDVTCENSILGIRRRDYTTLDTTVFTTGKHDVCVAGDGSVTRVRSDGAGNILTQRNTTPTTGAGYAAAFTNRGAGKGNEIACAARGANVIVAYVLADGVTIKTIESTDNGATFGAETAVVASAAAVIDLAVTYKSSGTNIGIHWARGTTIDSIRRTAGAYGAVVSSALAAASLNGIAAAYGFDYDLLITGVEVTTNKPTVWTLVFGDGSDAAPGTYGALNPQVQAESDALVTFAAPFVESADCYRLTFVEADTFTGGSTRTYRSWVHPAMTFAAGPFTIANPQPVNFAGVQGIAIASDGGGSGATYESSASHVARAPIAQVLSTLTNDILAIDIRERGASTRGTIDLDNSAGAYAAANNSGTFGDPPAPIQIGNLVGVAWGYRTTSGLLSSRMADLWIRRYEYIRDGGLSVLRLHVDGGWEALARTRTRTAVVHTADTYLNILQRICSRAGIQLTSSAVSARAQAVTPKTTLHPYTTAREHTLALLAYVADRIIMRTIAGATITEPLPGAAAAYTFGGAHAIYHAVASVEPPPIAQARAFGAAAYGDAIDYDNAQLAGVATYEDQRDQTSATGATAAATATAHLRQRALDAHRGSITAPPNCGQQVLDVVALTDPLVSSATFKARVRAITWKYDRRKSVYQQTLELGAL
jgi:hypothetical protein